MEVREAIASAVKELAQSGVDSPRLTAELLLGHVLGWDRVRVLAHGESLLSEEAADRFRALVRRRVAGEPLQYIRQVQEFYGRSFLVSPAVLIPRPETEILVEKAVMLAARKTAGLRFVDVGAGSGCIAVSLAKELPSSTGLALDISPEALAVARQNAERHAVAARLQFARCDLLDCFPPAPLFDFILSNPPYAARQDMESLAPMVRDYEPHAALFAGETGMEIFGRLISQATPRLKPGGHFLIEVGAGQADAVARLVERHDLYLETILQDLQGIPRCLIAQRRN